MITRNPLLDIDLGRLGDLAPPRNPDGHVTETSRVVHEPKKIHGNISLTIEFILIQNPDGITGLDVYKHLTRVGYDGELDSIHALLRSLCKRGKIRREKKEVYRYYAI